MSAFDEFRAYLKPKGANPEIDSAFYELASMEHISGMWNCEVLTLGFRLDNFAKEIIFRAIDRTKPIVFAIKGFTGNSHFIVVDAHTPGKKHGRMVNFKPFKTNDYLVDCGGRDMTKGGEAYWAIKTGGETYVYGHSFPNTWTLKSLEPLCAFIGGGLTPDELRAQAYRQYRDGVKEERREAHILDLLVGWKL